MKRLHVVTALSVLALLAAPAAAAGPNEVSQFAKDIKARLGTLKASLLDLDAQFAVDIASIQTDYLSQAFSAANTHIAVFDLVVALDVDVAAALQVCTDGIEADASGHLQAIATFPNAFAVGDGGLIDDAQRKATKLRVKSTVANFKKVHKLAGLMKLIDNYDLIFDRRGQVVEPMTPSDAVGEEAAAPAKMLRVDLLMSGSAKSADGDGVMCLTGTANLGGTDHVDIAIERVGDTPVATTATIDPVTARWSKSFDELPEGIYAVTVSQDGVAVSDSLAIQ